MRGDSEMAIYKLTELQNFIKQFPNDKDYVYQLERIISNARDVLCKNFKTVEEIVTRGLEHGNSLSQANLETIVSNYKFALSLEKLRFHFLSNF
jgi:hypothetical protein